MLTSGETWVAALVTLALWTWLLDRNNPVFNLAQYLYIGLSFAYGISLQYWEYLRPNLVKIGAGQWTLVIPIIIALLLYLRYSKQFEYLSRWSIAFFVGYGAGYVLAFQPHVFLGQVSASFYQLWGNVPGGSAVIARDWILLLVLLASLMYFFFTVRKDNKLVSPGATIGRYAIMVALGSGFGATILYRYSLLFGRVYFIFHTWLHIV
jgi:hypothetical protein